MRIARAGLASSAIEFDGAPADFGQARAAGRIDVEPDDLVTRVNQALGVDFAHQAETDNGNGGFAHHASGWIVILSEGMTGRRARNCAFPLQPCVAWRYGLLSDFDQYRAVPDLLRNFTVFDSGAALTQMHKIIDAQRLSGCLTVSVSIDGAAANVCRP